jgi:hypothetical protein
MMIPPQPIMVPRKTKPVYMATIRQALNGYLVIVEEDAQLPDTEEAMGIEEQMEMVMKAVSNVSNIGDSEIQRIIRENNKKPDINELPKIKKVGMRIFSTLSEALAFLSFIFEEESIEETIKPLKKNDNNI